MRAFDDADVIHVEDRVDPVDDINIITSELRIKDLEFMKSHMEKMNKEAQRAGTFFFLFLFSAMTVCA